jgi:hypothetical protein
MALVATSVSSSLSCRPTTTIFTTTHLGSQFSSSASSPNIGFQLLILRGIEEHRRRRLCISLYVSCSSSSASPSSSSSCASFPCFGHQPSFFVRRKQQQAWCQKGLTSIAKLRGSARCRWQRENRDESCGSSSAEAATEDCEGLGYVRLSSDHRKNRRRPKWDSHEPPPAAAAAAESKGLLEIYDLCRRVWEDAVNCVLVKKTPTTMVKNWVMERLGFKHGETPSSPKLLVWMATVMVAVLVMTTSLGASNALVMAPRKLQGDELATVQLFQENTPSVVYITNLAVRRDVFTLDVMAVPQGSGSGFIWDKKGHIVTNYHVIRGASDLRVTLGDQTVYEADVVGFDEDKDVAVLHIDAPWEKLRPLPVGRSDDLLVGQKVFAIGNPFGLDHTLTTGVISGLRREISSAATGRPIQDVIQTDAAINPGNSGGPLLDSAGNLIGINTAIYSPSGASSGVGFSIPVDTVSDDNLSIS